MQPLAPMNLVNGRFETTLQHLRRQPLFPHKLMHTADKLYRPQPEPIRTMIARGVPAVFLEDKEQGVKTDFNRRIVTLLMSFPIIISVTPDPCLLLTSM